MTDPTPITDEELAIARQYGHTNPFEESLYARIDFLKAELAALRAPVDVEALARECAERCLSAVDNIIGTDIEQRYAGTIGLRDVLSLMRDQITATLTRALASKQAEVERLKAELEAKG